MQGKIFAESMNLYQDQAKLLFNYYRKAAEKIVKEETELEKSIERAKAEIVLAGKNKIKGIIITAVFGAVGIALAIFMSIIVGVIVILGAIWGVVTLVKAKKSREENVMEGDYNRISSRYVQAV